MRNSPPVTATLALLAILAAGCERDTSGLKPYPLSTDPIVFQDGFTGAVEFQAFLGSNLGALFTDTNEAYEGTASLRVEIPRADNPDGGWAGGAFTADVVRNLSGYDALTFWAKSSKPTTLDIAGLGNDNTGTSKYEASWSRIALTTTWTKYVIPVPLPERLASERGLFFFAEGPEGNEGHQVWFDEIMFEKVGTITHPRPSMASQTVNAFVGTAVAVTGTRTIFDVDGTDETIAHMPGYFSYISSDESVALYTGGEVRVVGGGSAVITALLGTVEATGEVTVVAIAPPDTPAPAPTLPADDVISLFSNVYSDVLVDTWSAGWDLADVTDLVIGGDDVKAYTNFIYAGIEFTTETIDATSMTHFHVDVWVPEGNVFRVKLVDFGADGAFGGGDDSEHEIAFSAATTPPLVTATWVGLDIPLSEFTRLVSRAHLAQLIISGDMGTSYIDNVYFHR